MYDNLKVLNDKIEDARKEVRQAGEATVKAAFTELFDKYPALQAVRWRQYTPYFNDGDSCTFGVCDWYVKIQGAITHEDDADDLGEHGFISEYNLKKSKIDVPCQEMKEDIRTLFKLAGDDVMELTFGDHAEITATPNGFDIEEYEHD